MKNILSALSGAVVLCTAALILSSCNPSSGDGQAAETKSALDVIQSRKSVRSFTSEPVSDADIQTILRCAMSAPSGMDVRPWRFVVVKDPGTIKAVAGPRGGFVATAPVLVVVCGETVSSPRPRPGDPEGEARLVPNRNWTADCAAASQNLLLAVEALGLGATWTACYPYEDRMSLVREALGLPDNVSPYNVIPIGHPDGEFTPKDKWNPENIHYDKW